MPDTIKQLKDIKELLVKLMTRTFISDRDVAELAKAYAMIDYQIVSRKEKDMECD